MPWHPTLAHCIHQDLEPEVMVYNEWTSQEPSIVKLALNRCCQLYTCNNFTEQTLRLSFYVQVPPSVYTQEMLQTTEERLASTQEIQPPRILELLDMSDHEVSFFRYLSPFHHLKSLWKKEATTRCPSDGCCSTACQRH